MNRIPGDPFDSSNRGLVEAFDTERGNFIKHAAPVLESIISCPVCRAECPSTSLALVAATPSPPGPVEAVVSNDSGVTFL